MSIEALAMAGADYMKCSISLEVWEGLGTVETPAYLLAEEDLQNPVIKSKVHDLVSDNENFAAQILAVAKAVVSTETKASEMQ